MNSQIGICAGPSGGGGTAFLLGYIQRGLLAIDSDVEWETQALETFAQRAGYRLSSVYVDKAQHGDLNAFRSLIEAALDGGAAAVVLPSLLHFSGLGHAGSFAAVFEQVTGARVLTVAAT